MTISEENLKWIKERSVKNPAMSEEQIAEWFNEAIDSLKVVGMDVALGGEDTKDFLDMVKTATVGKIQANLSVEPTEFQMMMLGPYPQRNIGKKPFVEMVGFASLDGNDPEISTITAWESFVSSKNDVEPLGSYQTGVSFFKDDRKTEPKMFRLSVQGATEFSDNTKCDFMSPTYDEKIIAVRAGVPKVDLGSAGNNLSKSKKNVKSGKSYPDSLDLKRIIVQVVGTSDGVDKNGRAWAMYHVVDGTFNPTVKIKHIAVWVDPSIFERLQAGEGSHLEIYGMLQKRDNDEVPSMSACFIHPLAIKPLERKENQAQTDQPGGTVAPPEEPQIKVMMNAGM